MKLYRWTIAFVLLAASLVWGQQSPVKTVVIHAGRLLDVKTGRLLLQQQIVIEGGKITSVGLYDLTPNAEPFIDLTNATVLPGLIDAHTHITFNPNFSYSALGISVPR